MPEEGPGKKQQWIDSLKTIWSGMADRGMAHYAVRTRGNLEQLFLLVILGDLLGVPLLPPYYRLRLLPYLMPQIDRWKRSMLREKDMNDALD